jgi:hypothetical protein
MIRLLTMSLLRHENLRKGIGKEPVLFGRILRYTMLLNTFITPSELQDIGHPS